MRGCIRKIIVVIQHAFKYVLSVRKVFLSMTNSKEYPAALSTEVILEAGRKVQERQYIFALNSINTKITVVKDSILTFRKVIAALRATGEIDNSNNVITIEDYETITSERNFLKLSENKIQMLDDNQAKKIQTLLEKEYDFKLSEDIDEIEPKRIYDTLYKDVEESIDVIDSYEIKVSDHSNSIYPIIKYIKGNKRKVINMVYSITQKFMEKMYLERSEEKRHEHMVNNQGKIFGRKKNLEIKLGSSLMELFINSLLKKSSLNISNLFHNDNFQEYFISILQTP